VVDLDEHADPALRQPGQQPYLPQWPGPVQAAPPQLLGDAQQRGLVTGVRERQDLYVIGEVEGRGVHPQRPARPWPGHVQQLPEPGHQVQPGGDHLPDRLDPQPAARTGQAAVQDGQRADVLRPELIGPQHALVFVGQPVRRGPA
jgi:hypothetical protein